MENIKRFVKYLGRQKKYIIAGVVFTIGMGLVQIFTGTLLKLITDSIEKFVENADGTVPLKLSIPLLKSKLKIINTILSGREEIFTGLLYVGLAYLVFSVLEMLFEYFREVYMRAAAQKILQNFKSDIYSKVLRLPYLFYYKHKTGDLISRITYDVTTMTDIINLFIELTRSFVYLVILLPVMFFISWKITLAIIVFFPLSIFLIQWIVLKIKSVSKGITDNVGDYTAFLDEKINNFRLVKIFGREEKEQKEFEELIETNYQLNLKNIKLISFLKPSNQLLGIVCLVLVFIYFNYKMVYLEAGVGNAVFYLYILSQAFKPIKKLARSVGDLQVAAVSIKKIFVFLDTDEENDYASVETKEPGHFESLEFCDVNFGYTKEKPVLKNLNVKFDKSQIVALTGKSGSGKTTFVKLIARFFEIDSGAILFNDLNIRDLRLKYLRRKVVVVNQHTSVFRGTLADNLFYGSEKITDIKINELKTILKIDDLNTGIEVLSEGQKKIISIFRAMLYQPDVLILDEIFESIDKEIVIKLFRMLESIPLLLVVTRHDVIIEKADKVYNLENGILQLV